VTRRRVVVVGAGMGGLLAALRLARAGCAVQLFEARPAVGGLASSVGAPGGLVFDGGPYILLDRWGLEWALRAVGLDLAGLVTLRRVEELYRVETDGGPPVEVFGSLDRTADGFERAWPGSGARYRSFVARSGEAYRRLQPLLVSRDPRRALPRHPVSWPAVPWVLRSLEDVLDRAELPGPVRQAIGIWTAIAGQRPDEAPGPMAFVPGLIHGAGAHVVEGGLGTIPIRLASELAEAGVSVHLGTAATRVRTRGGQVDVVETSDGRTHAADAVVSNVGLPTYAGLVEGVPENARRGLLDRPLQSPGVCAYLAVKGLGGPTYLRFRVGTDGVCRLLVRPGTVTSVATENGWQPARLIAPLDHARARREGPEGQRRYLDALVAEPWWREGLEVEVRHRRVPADWGREFRLHEDAMNPVMTARAMRAGRLPHRSPWIRGLYLAGAATHPGQWVSFAAVSGIHAADTLLADLA
jgi:1-hydroxycarotenoid 3,4-desaturase